jgi:membrane protease YdiL (CAAX protease family)
MIRKKTPFQQYLTSSRNFHYGVILTLPALILYELGIFALFRDSHYELRNSGEVLLRQVFHSIGLDNVYLIAGFLLTFFLVVMIRGYRLERAPGIHANFLVFMLAESVLWGCLLYLTMLGYARIPMQLHIPVDKLANINLAIGAGIFEELIFRMVLISAVLVIFQKGFRQTVRFSEPMAVLISAIIFAAFHLFMESFSVAIFLQRVLGGVFLGYLYLYRGYGISVYSHIVFNLLILSETW